MSDQDGTQSSTKPRRSRKTNIGKQENGKQALAVQRPSNEDTAAWKVHWQIKGQPWRTEPEIDEERQQYLAECRNIEPNIEQGIYSFKGIKLSRADVEWLLATHENGRGSVDWEDASQRQRYSVDLRGADLRNVNLQRLPLVRIRAGLTLSELEEATDMQSRMAAALMEGAYLRSANLEFAFLSWVCLKDVDLRWSNLRRARLHTACLEHASLIGAYLEGAQLNNLILSDEKRIGPRLADIQWGVVNLAVVKWSQMEMLGDEHEARQKRSAEKVKDRNGRLEEYEKAVRANRQLAVVLREQGLNEEADQFAYRAQLLQRVVWRYQRRWLRYAFSWLLDLLAGYGYRPIRGVVWYLIIVFGFAVAYFVFGHISPLEAFVFSLTSFHGRGFFPGTNISLSDPRIVLAAFEAVVGLLIEISFIATFTQRFFGK